MKTKNMTAQSRQRALICASDKLLEFVFQAEQHRTAARSCVIVSDGGVRTVKIWYDCTALWGCPTAAGMKARAEQITERIANMGYCILVVHGLNRLCSLVGRWGATALTVSMLLLLLLFSWKTVQQNEIWLSREALFRSGIQTLPHNAKVHYNYANFLKDRGRNQEAIHHYKTALSNLPADEVAGYGVGVCDALPGPKGVYKSHSTRYCAVLETLQHNADCFPLMSTGVPGLPVYYLSPQATLTNPLLKWWFKPGSQITHGAVETSQRNEELPATCFPHHIY
ncbi:hypothetical protein JZ751_016077 [Albula glossodonta]|uniref:Uncharacterized protein n=1 Tax=Albula glossodonta TaxID=121402 RepID=A0A8T2NTV2_9TELE|nr:hypothetical protein JZ751_016077 [Albula glossodonta]